MSHSVSSWMNTTAQWENVKNSSNEDENLADLN